MKKRMLCGLMLAFALVTAGCQERARTPLPGQSAPSQEVLAQAPELSVSHSIEGNTVYLTFLTRNFMYAPENAPQLRPGEGHVHVLVDKKATKVYTNHVTVPNLSPGPHTFVVQLVRNNHQPYANTKIEFTINIKG
jgi:hypothetical protein